MKKIDMLDDDYFDNEISEFLNSENKKIITEVQKVEKSSNAKPFDYYFERGLTREEQGKKQENVKEKTGCLVKKIRNKNSEQERVRAFKRTLNAPMGIEVYKKILEDTANMQEEKYKENKAKEQDEK